MLFKILQIDCLYLRSFNKKCSWNLAMSLILHLQIGQEHEISFLFKNVLFSPNYIDSVDQISSELSELSVENDRFTDSKSVLNIDTESEKHFKVDLEAYLRRSLLLYHGLLLPNEKKLLRSEFMHYRMCYSTANLTINSNGETVLPTDWQYFPLLTILHQRQSNSTHGSKLSNDRSSDETEVSRVRDCLLWVYICTSYFSDNNYLSSSSIALRLSRLSTVFLAAPDLFMDTQIHSLLKRCLNDALIQTSKRYKNGVKFSNKKIPGIDSFKEYYEELINQFEAVSYGNQLFAMVLLLPLTAINTWEYRRYENWKFFSWGGGSKAKLSLFRTNFQ